MYKSPKAKSNFFQSLTVLIFHFTENATTEIQKQDVDRKKSHRRILQDLNNIRNKAEEVWNKIGENFIHRKVISFCERKIHWCGMLWRNQSQHVREV